MISDKIEFRKIDISDNMKLGRVMEEVLREYNAVEGQSMLGDPTLYKMYEEYQNPRSVYYIAVLNGELVGGCGVNIIPNQDDDSLCELQRMYLARHARGKKIGEQLIDKCIDSAKDFGYKKMYIESFPQMKEAISLYTKKGFYHIDHPIGNTGHIACDIRMLKEL